MLTIIDFNKTVYELYKDNEEIAKVLEEIGFKDITKPNMISTMGRFMTIPKGAKAKGFNIDEIKKEFIKRGYEIKE
jgi:thiamine biosynthesis lipoprotein ApbE